MSYNFKILEQKRIKPTEGEHELYTVPEGKQVVVSKIVINDHIPYEQPNSNSATSVIRRIPRNLSALAAFENQSDSSNLPFTLPSIQYNSGVADFADANNYDDNKHYVFYSFNKRHEPNYNDSMANPNYYLVDIASRRKREFKSVTMMSTTTAVRPVYYLTLNGKHITGYSPFYRVGETAEIKANYTLQAGDVIKYHALPALGAKLPQDITVFGQEMDLEGASS